MADQFTYAKLPADPCLTEEQLLAYIDGKLPVDAQHACEKHMLDCEMCSDAAEGLALVKDRAAITAPLKSNGASVAEKGKVVSLNKPNRKLWYSVAAVLVLVLASTFFFQQVAQNDKTSMADNQATTDSMSATSGGFPSPPPASDCVARNDQSLLKNDGKPVVPSDGSPLATQERTKGYGDDANADDAKYYRETEKPLVPKTSSPDMSYDLVETEETAPIVAEEMKEEDVDVEATEEADKKNSFWEKTKLVLPANNQARSEQQSLSQDNDRVAKEDKQQKDSGTKSAENKNGGATEPEVAETIAMGNVTMNDEYSGAAAGDSTQFNAGPSPQKPAAQNLELSYTNGVNLMNSGQYNSAIALFDEVLQDSTHARYEDAEFQKAKTLIKASRKDEAKILLKAIEAKKGKHAAEATELLKTL